MDPSAFLIDADQEGGGGRGGVKKIRCKLTQLVWRFDVSREKNDSTEPALLNEGKDVVRRARAMEASKKKLPGLG